MSAELRAALYQMKRATEENGTPVIYLHQDGTAAPFAVLLTIEAFFKFVRTTNEDWQREHGAEQPRWDPMDHSHIEGDEDE